MKMIYGHFNPISGVSAVILQNRNGKYKGIAKLHIEDQSHASENIGCTIAEERAWINYYKAEIKRIKIKKQELESILKDICVNTAPGQNSEAKNRILMKIRYYNKEIEEKKEYIAEIKDAIQVFIKTLDKYHQREKQQDK